MSDVSSISSDERRSRIPEHFIDEDEDDDDQRERGSSDTLIHGDRPEASVGLLYLFMLTFGVGGLQVVWSVILANGSPFLLSLGLSKSLTALVWIAAPLCGMVVQPIVGLLSDQSRNRWGRRRPFIIGGAIGTIISMLALAWVEDVIHGLAKAFGGDPQSHALQTLIVVLAVFGIYALNISIQPLQACLRALIIENCPMHQQTQASAWASGMVGVGNIIGYLSGFSALPTLFSFMRLTQFQALCLIASLALIITLPISCSGVNEKTPKDTPLVARRRAGLVATLRDLVRTYKYMPPKIRDVLQIQFCSWMGWFSFLFYSTTFVGEFYTAETKMTLQLSPDAVRSGAFASLLFAIVALTANLALPFLLQSSKKDYEVSEDRLSAPLLSRIVNHPKLGIQPAWTCAHVFFACGMFATFLVNSLAGATVLVAFMGLSWAFSLWAPFAIIGTEIAARHQSLDEEQEQERSAEAGAGAIMGLHNVSMAAPQIVAALISSGIFWIAQVSGSKDGTGWVLRAGGIAGLGAASLTSKMRD